MVTECLYDCDVVTFELSKGSHLALTENTNCKNKEKFAYSSTGECYEAKHVSSIGVMAPCKRKACTVSQVQ